MISKVIVPKIIQSYMHPKYTYCRYVLFNPCMEEGGKNGFRRFEMSCAEQIGEELKLSMSQCYKFLFD